MDLRFGTGGNSVVVVGDNGQGKSTILRSLAMGLCDQSSASALFRELPGEYVRHGAEGDGTIDVYLSGAGSYTYQIRTTIKSLKTFERVVQTLYRFHGSKRAKLTQDDFPWERIFASGYGAGIRVEGTQEYNYYLTVDAVYSLFRYDVQLNNPELIIRRIVSGEYADHSDARRRKQVLGDLKHLLDSMLELDAHDTVELTSTGIGIRRKGDLVDLGSAGDGYKATITWVVDLLAWWFLKAQQEERETELHGVSGIVLIDEIEQHLHPKWQRHVVRKLSEAFPNIQLLATTHSPVVASGCEHVQVYRVEEGIARSENPYGWLAEDVYRFMGLDSSRAGTFRQDVLDEFTELDIKRLRGKATPADMSQLRSLRKRLDDLPEDDPVHLLNEIANIRKAIERDGANDA